VLAILICIGEAFVYVWSGSYGRLNELGYGNAILIMLQLALAGIVVILLDEMLQAGYGMGSGISLFIATNIAENIIWKCFSPITIRTGRTTEFEGILVAILHKLFTSRNKTSALMDLLVRTNAPNIGNLLATIFIFLMVIYFQEFKVLIKLRSQ